MKKIYILVFLLIAVSAVSQINSPNGNNIFTYNGLADVILSFPERGSGGRAVVHDDGNILSLNYASDFTGGTRIGANAFFKDGGNSYIYSGNLGIGTVNPLAKLEIANGNLLVRNIVNTNETSSIMIAHSVNVNSLDDTGTSIRTITQNAGGNNYAMQFFTEDSYLTGQTEKVRILGNGNVGIGTQSPNSKLSVVGGLSKLTLNGIDGAFDNLIKYGHKSDLESQNSYANRWHGIDATITAGSSSQNKLKFRLYAGGTANLEPNDVMVLVGNGNVGIGVTNPGNKLDVKGTIHSQEVKVDMTGWSDFVFKKEYNLPTLEQVEKHIAEKGHLENIPNEEEVLKNGINVGEMNAKLLQKIEELTLYLIDKDKQINFLLNENDRIKKNSDDLKKTLLERMEKLEAKIN